MKNLIATLLLTVIGVNADAQRVIEKNIDYRGQIINIEVPFASEIELKTWDKPTIYVKASLVTEKGKYLDLYELNIRDTDNRIDIVSNADTLFKKYQEDYEKQNPQKESPSVGNITYSNRDVIIHEGLKYQFDYVIYIPEGAEFEISSINGNLVSDVIKGNFTANLINGKINIKEYSGDLNLSTINGEIDIHPGESTWMAETIHGKIYADEDLAFTSEERVVGQQLQSAEMNGSSQLYLSTINGNMYLR